MVHRFVRWGLRPPPLEQRCLKPGLWIIEGYTAQKLFTTPMTWEIRHPSGHVAAYAKSLPKAKKRIRELLADRGIIK